MTNRQDVVDRRLAGWKGGAVISRGKEFVPPNPTSVAAAIERIFERKRWDRKTEAEEAVKDVWREACYLQKIETEDRLHQLYADELLTAQKNAWDACFEDLSKRYGITSSAGKENPHAEPLLSIRQEETREGEGR